jgi:predicted Zn-dependent peptidase
MGDPALAPPEVELIDARRAWSPGVRSSTQGDAFQAIRDIFREIVAQIIEQSLPKDQAQELALRCAQSEPDAVEKVRELLANHKQDLEEVLDQAESARAEELAHAYARREPDAVNQVNELLAASGQTVDNIRADAFMGQIEKIERIDRQITVAETRRNASLRELGRHRAVVGEALRQKMQGVEEAQIEVTEPVRRKG